MMAHEKVFVLDTAAFLHPLSVPTAGVCLTTSAVDLEVRNSASKAVLDNWIQVRGLRIRDPQMESQSAVFALLSHIRDARLSKTDEGLLALALECKAQGFHPILLTDDYSLQNACRHAKVSFKGVIMPGIRKKRTFSAKKSR